VPAQEKLFIQAVRHKAFVAVGSRGWPPQPFRVDRPFVFVIRHKPTNSVAFLGRVVDPSRQSR
jgi:serine protease inhibitor